MTLLRGALAAPPRTLVDVLRRTAADHPDEPALEKRVVRGGSFLCNACYCKGYRVSARMSTSVDSGLNHTGFRCVMSPDQARAAAGRSSSSTSTP